MKIVALTGGIGSGKSTVAKMFRSYKVPVYDSDKEAKLLLNTSKILRKKLISLLGEAAYGIKGLNRSYVSNKVFENKKLLNKMNKIVHPAVRSHFIKWTEKQDAPYIVQEAAIIFENGNQHNYDTIVLVTAPQDIRIERVMNRDNVSREKVIARLNNQWSDHEKIPLSDFVIQNIDLVKTEAEVFKIHQTLLSNN